MRIGIVSETWSPEINGVALTVAGLAHELAEAGHSLQIIRPRQRADTNTPPAQCGIETSLVKGMALPRYPGLQFGLPCARRLRTLWKNQRPDAIYVATEGPLGWSALRAAHALGIPASTGFHTRFDDFARHYGLGMLAPLMFAWLRRFHRRAAATFVPTVDLAEFLGARRFGKVVHLPRAVDTRLFTPTRRDESLRERWGLRPDALAVIYVGRIAAEKNLPLAVRGFRALARQVPGARYIWVGDGPARAALARDNPDFVFAGIQRGEALARHFASADLFLFPSLTETFGNVTLEALASGVPTVAFDYGAAREHLTDACGRLVRFGDADAFVDAACSVVRNRAAFDALRIAARLSVATLDPHVVAAKFAAALADLATPGAPLITAAATVAHAGGRSADAPPAGLVGGAP